jgi:diacylglycerol O-acyltransferase / wax synthase
MLVTIRADGGLADRVARAAAVTSERKRAARGTSAGLLGPLFRLLAVAGLLRWFFNHQRLVTTFVTNLRGPAEPLTLAGAPLRVVLPVPETTGNIPVTFAALSYAGTLWLTVLSDPALVPDVAVLTTALSQELAFAIRAREDLAKYGGGWP